MTGPADPRADQRAARRARAEGLFAAFLARHESPDHPAFESFCRDHAVESEDLAQLASDWRRMDGLVDALGGGFGDAPTDPTPDREPNDAPPGPREPPSVDRVIERCSRSEQRWKLYRVDEEVDRGGMGRILKVWDRSLRRPLAMKVMLKGTRDATSGEESADDRQLSRFLEEAQITGQLDHPGIVPVHELGLDRHGHLFFTMRLVRGRSLRTIFELVTDAREGWTVARALGALLKVCEALAFAHSKQVVHRDIKPANVMVGRFGETYVMDWGLAKVLGREDPYDLRPAAPPSRDAAPASHVLTDRAELGRRTPDSPLVTRDGTVVGTPAYMSPEQASGDRRAVGPTSDVYAVGTLLYELLSGRAPYAVAGQQLSPHEVLDAVREGPPTPVLRLAPRVPPELVAICEKAMARQPGLRYANMGEMAEELRAYLEGRVVAAYEAGAWARLRKWVGRNRVLAAVILVALAALGSALAWALVERDAALQMTSAEHIARQAAQTAAQQALDNARQASLARTQAEQARNREAAAAAATRAASYMAFVGAAQGHLEHREHDGAARLLAGCPPEQRGWEWSLLQQSTDSSLARLEGHEAPVTDVDFGPQGKLLASVGRDGSVRVWDALEWKQITSIGFDDGAPEALALHPAGRGLAVAVTRWGSSSEIRLFDARHGTWQRTLRLPDAERQTITRLAFGPLGHQLAAAMDSGRVIVYALPSGEPHPFLRLHTGPVRSLAFDRGGRTLLSGSDDGRVLIWDAAHGNLELELPLHDGAVLSVATSPRADLAATGCADGRLRLFDLGQPERPLFVLDGHDGAVTGVAFSADGARVLSSSTDRSLRVWDAYSGENLGQYLGHGASVNACAVSPSGRLFASASDDGSLRLWDPERLGSVVLLEGHGDRVAAVSLAGAENLIASLAYDGELRLWNLDEHVELDRLTLAEAQAGVLALSPDLTRVAVAGQRRDPGGRFAIELIPIQDRSVLSGPPVPLRGHDQPVESLAFASDGELLASASRSGEVRWWDARSGELAGEHRRHQGSVRALAFEPGGRLLASGGSDDRVLLFDPIAGQLLWSADELGAAVRALAFRPDGARLAVACGADVLLLATRDGSLLRRLSGHDDEVLDLAWHPTQDRLVSTSKDKTLRLWDTGSGFVMLSLRVDQPVPSIAFDRRGENLVAALGRRLTSWQATPALDGWRHRAVGLDQARQRFESLLDQLVDPREVSLALERDRGLPPALRAQALALSRQFGRDAGLLANSAWGAVVDPELGPERLADALRRARAATRLGPDNPDAMSALGLALYRAGEWQQAIDWSDRADRANQDARHHPRTWDLYALAMEHTALGARQLAGVYLAAAESERQEPGFRDDAVTISLRAEVTTLER